ncbi:MAG: PAS domain-containing sensor histidine kinase, partial [Chloroflexota bacterium]|nr:PAS domain-containing sensor histidine kinase [Chloroflexota bacterium]
EAANKELEAFSHSVSHDLRAPLNHIQYFTQALVEDAGAGLNAKAREDVARILSSTRRMSELMDDLLKLSRVTRAELRRAPVDLSALARQIIQDLCQRAPARQVECVVAEGLTAQGDPGLLQVVLENLIGNAWKYTAKQARARIEVGSGQWAVDSELSTTHPPLSTVYFVRDNGVGFNMKYAAKLFAPFQRLHSASEFEGTGIGLSIVQRVIRRHGGRIWVEAEEGKGATFYFTLET